MQSGQPNDYQNIINAAMAQDILAPSVYGSSAGSLLSGVMPQLQKNAIAQNALQNFGGAFNTAGGGQGLGGGLLSNISSLFGGTAAQTEATQRTAAASAIAQALGITPQAAAQLLPLLTQNQGIAGQTLGNTSSLLGSLGATSPSAIPAQ